MIDNRIAELFAEAARLMDKSVDTDVASQQRKYREAELSEWSETDAQRIADSEGFELTDAHLQVVQTLREHYREYGLAQSGRRLTDLLAVEYANLGGKKYLHRLFPRGPVSQGLRLA